jgi:hypothetical protein
MPAKLKAVSLRHLSDNLERMIDPAFLDYAEMPRSSLGEGGGATVGVHRCILASKSVFFLDHFTAAADKKPRLELIGLDLALGTVPRRRLTPAYLTHHSPCAPVASAELRSPPFFSLLNALRC